MKKLLLPILLYILCWVFIMNCFADIKVEKSSDNAIKLTTTTSEYVDTDKLLAIKKNLLTFRAEHQAQVDKANQQLLDIDDIIKKTKEAGVVIPEKAE